MNEFELIKRFFAAQPIARDDVTLGVGDDAALLQPPVGMQLVVTSDLLVSGVHFFPHADPAALGHKSLAVNLSDLAAMGADPAWFTLSLSLPAVDVDWLQAFCNGMYALARRYNVQLVGGDTTRGPLSIGITAHGFVPAGQALLRSGAKPGDRIYVTGVLGDAALALAQEQGKLNLAGNDRDAVGERLARPTPRVEVGRALRGIAGSAIDISDGLLADLGHILEQSNVGAQLRLAAIPLSKTYRSLLPQVGWDAALAGGDDYELCVTVPPARAGLDASRPEFACGLTYVGDIVAGRELEVLDASGKRYQPKAVGYDHFAHL